MDVDPIRKLDAIARRTAELLGERLGWPDLMALRRPCAYELADADFRLVVVACDALVLAPELRLAGRRAVAQSVVPTAILTVHAPWDTPWTHETAVHAAFSSERSLLAGEVNEGRLAFGASGFDVVAADHSRRLMVRREGWTLDNTPVEPRDIREARFAAIGAWQAVVAEPSGIM